jgi:hypothetical protein
MNERIKQLEQQVSELLAWKAERERQALPFDLDDASKAAIGAARKDGNGSTSLTQTYSVGGGAITGPKAYVSSRILDLGDERVEVPIIAQL